MTDVKPLNQAIIDDLLFKMGDMHSHYDIVERNGGFSLIRTFEIDDNMLNEYGLPEDGEQLCAWKPTLEEMHAYLLKKPTV